MKLPKVGIYLTQKEFDKLLGRHALIKGIVGKGEKMIAIRVEGRIGYHDYEKIKKQISREIQKDKRI